MKVVMMFVTFSPFSYFFLSVYFMMLSIIFLTPNFFIFWIIMEFMMLLFMGLSYSLITNSFSSLMLFFLLQTFSSFGLLTFYLFDMSFFFTLSFLLKLSMVPFHFWVVSIFYRLPNFITGLSLTVHKMPVFLMITYFNISLDMKMMWLSMMFSVLLSGFMMISTADLRLALISSSIGNNSWFFLASLASLDVFFTFFLIYTLVLFPLFFKLGNVSKESLSWSSYSKNLNMVFLVFLSGLPPFPMFFMKMLVLYVLIVSNLWSFLLFPLLISSAIMLVGYIQLIFKYIIYAYSDSILVLY